jgi:hypothetical protein
VGLITMKRWSALAAATLTCLGVLLAGAGTAAARPAACPARVSVSWARAQEVPGTAALNACGQAQVEQISCPAAGYCTAAGLFSDSAGHNESFVAGESKGRWGTARRLPGLAKLDRGGQDYVETVSCAKRGYCSAAGNYTDAAAQVQSYIDLPLPRPRRDHDGAGLAAGPGAARQGRQCAGPGPGSPVGYPGGNHTR